MRSNETDPSRDWKCRHHKHFLKTKGEYGEADFEEQVQLLFELGFFLVKISELFTSGQ